MAFRVPSSGLEFHKKRSFERRITVVYAVLVLVSLIIVSRLIELQIVRGQEYHQIAQAQHFGGIVLPAKRGEILSRNSKTNETSILATNTTLDLLYVDPLIVMGGHEIVADALAEVLVTDEFDMQCRQGLRSCPRELIPFYRSAFDPLATSLLLLEQQISTGSFLREIPQTESGRILPADIPDITEVRRQFARSIEERIRRKSVTFVPLLYGANKVQQEQVESLRIPGIFVNTDSGLVYANPDRIDQGSVVQIARQLSPILVLDPDFIRSRLRQRPLRYVPIMARLPIEISSRIKEMKVDSYRDTEQRRIAHFRSTGEYSDSITDPFRGVALIPEHWRFYPDTTIASHVLGFMNASQEPQYGIERTFDPTLRGQEGLISTVSDPFGGQIASSQEQLVDPRDGSTIVLSIDRFIQNHVETLLDEKIREVEAQSGQAIVMDPKTGRILAMANAPRFDSNSYESVFDREPILLTPEQESRVIVEVFHPVTNSRVMLAYYSDLTPQGRESLSPEMREELEEIEKLYELPRLTRYYMLVGEHHRREIFPTERDGVWLKYRNNIGIGSYLNRTIQEIYEPGSVLKAITMAIAIDQGETVPSDMYDDNGPLKVDEFTIRNALNRYYGRVSMTNCMEFSINTCMTSVSRKLGRKLFYTALTRFGLGTITGVELDNELPGEIRHWREWSDALLSTASYGQGISATPLQVITAFAVLANNGKLMKPTIIDEIRHSDGTVEKRQPIVVDQVIKPETAATMTAMLISSVRNGFARAAAVPGYTTAGKTGTSQIAGPGGRYETGTGSTIATYAGYAPPDNPRFVILIKIDRAARDEFGSLSAAPLFRDISRFLFEYYGIPPDGR